mmetsp:Transcript_38225/g.101496  ORF Transcript_38225/g.101496 Transcript_38225/m.101496 type:complete len:94 (+) Transcript_38225:646-927(+)
MFEGVCSSSSVFSFSWQRGIKEPIWSFREAVLSRLAFTFPTRSGVVKIFSSAGDASSTYGKAATKRNGSEAAPDQSAYGGTDSLNWHVDSDRQ